MLSRGFWIDLLTRDLTQLCRIMIRTYCWQARKRSPNNIVAQRANGNGTALTATTRPSSESPEAGNHDGPNMSWVSGDSVRMTLVIGNLNQDDSMAVPQTTKTRKMRKIHRWHQMGSNWIRELKFGLLICC